MNKIIGGFVKPFYTTSIKNYSDYIIDDHNAIGNVINLLYL